MPYSERGIFFSPSIVVTSRRGSILRRGIRPGTRVKFGWMIYKVLCINDDWTFDLNRLSAQKKIVYLARQSPLSFAVVANPNERDVDGN